MTDVTHDEVDDGFHEIHLSGKQLFALFMATVVVSVVIFLIGVFVGRNVRSQQASAAEHLSDSDCSDHARTGPTARARASQLRIRRRKPPSRQRRRPRPTSSVTSAASKGSPRRSR